MKPTLIVFAKEPKAGQVKTRLARDIGTVGAVWWYRHQTARLLRTLARDRRWRTVLAVSPDISELQSRAWYGGVERWPQGRGNLGTRMGRALRRAAMGPVVLIGSDIPDVAPRHIAEAFCLLGRHDAVIGPATDGGFWLVGLRRGSLPVPGLFDGVRWSGQHALADTLRTFGDLRIGFAATLNDVDTGEDLAPGHPHSGG